ncbi:MAG: carbohydrate ABC transporter permease [Spirochaetes bacterium]|uniref:Carbohydrate ABC transporter permease n=1 Tax=Candidatus Ornithospirochaeta stercoripullorum TaxID=2840899 RepID=A0A9D9DWL0_9SPIO|nr:carbohydrate ABC transporter permease [Candidatus Ornithospirochaeta stercoripullorum]
MGFRKKDKSIAHKINWKKEAAMLPGYIIILIWIGFTAAFLLWILGASLSTTPEIMQGKVFKFETGLHFENYALAWSQQNVARYFANSLLYSIAGCFFTILISAPASYVLSRYKFICNKIIKSSLIVAMSVPAVMIVLPIYAITASWRNAPDRLIFTVLMIFFRVPYTTVYLLNFFATLSRSYEEAAAIDGCSPAGTFWRIMFPLVQPALVTVTIFNFLGIWNEFFMALIFASSQSVAPVGVGLLQIVNSMRYTGQYGALFAAVIIVFLPTFLLYIFLSEKIIAGVTGGGVKG